MIQIIMFLKLNKWAHRHSDKFPEFISKIFLLQDYQFELRVADLDDIKHLIAIEEAVYLGQAPWTTDDFYNEIIRYDVRLYLIIKKNQQVIGFVGAAYQRPTQDIHITNIAILPIWQNKGLGTILLHEIIKVAKRMHVQTLSLEARKSNNLAVALYERLGFKKVGIKSRYYLDNREDAISMEKKVEYPKSRH